MERRNFLKLTFGAAAGAVALAAGAQAAPLPPHPLPQQAHRPAVNEDVHPAVTSADEAEHLKPEEVHWHRHWHRRRHWHRHWRRRHW